MTRTKTVLHVDDDPAFLDVASKLFERSNASFETVSASNAVDGLRLLNEREIDCVVSDFLVTEDGRPFVVAARDADADVPIILLTGKSWEAVADEAVAANVTEYVRKRDAGQISVVKTRLDELFVDGSEETLSDSDIMYAHLSPTVALQPTSVGTLDSETVEEWVTIGAHDWESDDELGTSIAEALAETTGDDAAVSEPLFESIDTEALEAVLRPRYDGSERPGIVVQFPYRGDEVGVTSGGAIVVRRSEDRDSV